MTAITLNLPDSLIQRATQMATSMQRSVEEVLADTLYNALPDVSDAPVHMQAELLEMSHLKNQDLMTIAQSQLSPQEQQTLTELSQSEELSTQQQKQLAKLRQHYGQITLRKAHAYALLSLRGGKPSLSA